MDKNWRETMKGAISEVLETMFFTPVEFVGELAQQPAYACCSSVQLHNTQGYRAVFYFVEACAFMITANFLGKSEDQVTREEIADTLKEVANMVGGSFIFQGGLEDYKLGLPEFTWLDGGNPAEPQDGVPFFLDGTLFGLATLGAC